MAGAEWRRPQKLSNEFDLDERDWGVMNQFSPFFRGFLHNENEKKVFPRQKNEAKKRVESVEEKKVFQFVQREWESWNVHSVLR